MYRIRPETVYLYRSASYKSTAASLSHAEEKTGEFDKKGFNPRESHQKMQQRAQSQLPFAHAKVGTFVQDHPQLSNTFIQDTTLRTYLKRILPHQYLPEIESDLYRFGERAAGELYQLGQQCEREQPQLVQYDAWGNRVDQLITSPAWRIMHDVSAEEGLIATAYERKHGEYSRIHQMAKLYLFAASSGLYSCPLAMTDGAAKVTEKLLKQLPWIKDRAYQHLISRRPDQFWTSGQWMTEKRGGSDVAKGTETLARANGDGSYSLYGYKWFSSATDADMSLTLARIVDEEGKAKEGTQGLSLFYLEVRGEDGKLNNIQVQKLKNKLGTKQLPTAELLLDGTRAYLISDPGRGVAAISDMLTLTRLHNTISSAAGMRRMLTLSRDYSTRRSAFGPLLKDHPLHIQILARMEVETRGATLIALECARLLGREDVNVVTEDERLVLRLITPLAKLYTAKQAMAVASEGLESFGGQGYIEDTGLPTLLRDAQVLPIWEGTTNILSLDVLRSMAKSQGQVLKVFIKDVAQRTQTAQCVTQLSPEATKVVKASLDIVKFASNNVDKLEMSARDFAFSLTRTYIGALLLEQAASSEASLQDVYAAQCWCQKDLTPVLTRHSKDTFSKNAANANFNLVFDGYQEKSRL